MQGLWHGKDVLREWPNRIPKQKIKNSDAKYYKKHEFD